MAAMLRNSPPDFRLAFLLQLTSWVTSGSLSSSNFQAWEVGAKGPLSPHAAVFASAELADALSVEPVTANETDLHKAGLKFGFESRASKEPAWKRRAAAPWSFRVPRGLPTVARPSASVSGDAFYQLDMASVQGSVYLGGVPLVLLILACPIGLCICFFLFVDEIDSGPLRRDNDPKKRNVALKGASPEGATALGGASPGGATRSPKPQAERLLGHTSPQMAVQQPDLARMGRAQTSPLQQSPFQPSSVAPSLGSVSMPSGQLNNTQPALNRAQTSPPPSSALSTQLLAPVVTKTSGEVFVLQGRLLNTMQASENIKVTLGYTGEPYATIHINENQHGCGVLLEMEPRKPTAFFDTQYAVGRPGQNVPLAQRQVQILHAGPSGFDPTSDPVAVVAPSTDLQDEVTVSQPASGGNPPIPLLQVKLNSEGQASRVRTPAVPGGARTKVVGMIELDEAQQQRRLFVYCGIDPVLVLCSIVAATKLGNPSR